MPLVPSLAAGQRSSACVRAGRAGADQLPPGAGAADDPQHRGRRPAAARRRSGPGPAGLPLLLINGIGASLELLQPFVDELDPAIEVIRFDPPGVGGSPLPALPYRFSGLCRLIARLLDELGHDQVDVLGISWGGGVAQHFAAFQRRRCRRLVLVATATGALMVPARPAVLAQMVTPRRYLDRRVPAGGRGRHLRRIGARLSRSGSRADARREPGRARRGLPVPARGRGGLDQPAVPAAAPAADADPVRR